MGKTQTQNLFSNIYIYICFLKSILKTSQFANIKQKSMYKNQTSVFKVKLLVPSILPLLRKRIRLGHAGIVDHSVSLIDTRLKKSIKKEWMIIKLKNA